MSDPKRLLGGDGESGELGRLLSAGKSEVPDEAQMLALAAKIGVLGGLGGLGGAGALGGGGAAGAGGGGGAAAGGATASGGAGAAAGAGAKVAVGVTAAKVGLAVKIGGAVAIAGAVGGATVVATRHEPVSVPAGMVATSVTSETPTGAGSVSGSAWRIARTADLPEPSASIAPVATVRTSAAASTEGFDVEVKLLERAQDALRSRPEEALTLADDHARRFPRGMLVQEREVIAIEALVKLGRKADAKARATRFTTRFPGSSHTRRIQTLVNE